MTSVRSLDTTSEADPGLIILWNYFNIDQTVKRVTENKSMPTEGKQISDHKEEKDKNSHKIGDLYKIDLDFENEIIEKKPFDTEGYQNFIKIIVSPIVIAQNFPFVRAMIALSRLKSRSQAGDLTSIFYVRDLIIFFEKTLLPYHLTKTTQQIEIINHFVSFLEKLVSYSEAINPKSTEENLKSICNLARHKQGLEFICELTNDQLNVLNPALIKDMGDILDQEVPDLEKAPKLHKLFHDIGSNAAFARKENASLLLDLHKFFKSFIANQMQIKNCDLYNDVIYFLKKQEVKAAEVFAKLSQQPDQNAFKELFLPLSHVYNAYVGLESLNGESESKLDQPEAEVKKEKKLLLSPLLLEIKEKIYNQAKKEMRNLLKSNSLDYQGKVAIAISSAAMAFETPSHKNINEMVKCAGLLSHSRSYLGPLLLMGAGILIMLIGYAASANTFGISAYLSQQCGMTLIKAGIAGFAVGSVMGGSQFFGPSLEKSLIEIAPKLRKHYHETRIPARRSH